MDAYTKTDVQYCIRHIFFLKDEQRERQTYNFLALGTGIFVPCITHLVILLLSRKEGDPLLLGMESDRERDLVLVLDLEREADLL